MYRARPLSALDDALWLEAVRELLDQGFQDLSCMSRLMRSFVLVAPSKELPRYRRDQGKTRYLFKFRTLDMFSPLNNEIDKGKEHRKMQSV